MQQQSNIGARSPQAAASGFNPADNVARASSTAGLLQQARTLSTALQHSLTYRQGEEAAQGAQPWPTAQPANDLRYRRAYHRRQTKRTPKEGEIAPIGGWAKRAADIFIASVALVALAPLLLIAAALVKVTMGGPVIFAHARVGLNGRIFRCYKFRTMINGAEETLHRYLAQNPDIAEEWLRTRKIANDPRVTTFGLFLRKASLDELPQLINVLRGDMSCVGPRPIVPAEMERYGKHAHDYLRTRPGLTGLWQVSGRTSVSYDRRVTLDSLYVKQWSLWLDLAILLRTIPALLKFDQTA